MDTPSAPLFNAFMQDLAKQIVPLVVAELKAQTNAEGMGMIALDPNNIALPVHTLLTQDDNTREAIRDLIDDRIRGIDLDEFKEFRSMADKVDEIETKVDELECNGTPVDADDGDFQEAVRSVIRNHI